ncbi:ORF6N domain-containing protein [Massilia sp. CCM 8692]|uniref:ORF6N domain-containing protein n=2 Tax=Massilia rubra TaxID=2607910 RepID=A0ABX0M1D5_9BURK|nr:ORF6N domain-containing protein [Massilia rubra]
MAPIEHNDQRVMSLTMIDQVHQRPDGTAGRNFRENRGRLVAGEDFFEIDQPDEIRRLGFSRPQGGVPAMVLLLTETGYSMLVKSFTDDLAWHVQRQLVKSYFTKPAPVLDPLAGLPPEHRALVALMCDNASIKARQVEQAQVQAEQATALTMVDQRVSDMADSMLLLARPAGAESIVHIRARINRLYGLPARIVDEVLRQSPMAPKPAGMVKNAREEAQGASYAVFWTKDVSAVFSRFVNECKHVTVTQATHPYITGRFKLVAAGRYA